MSLIKGLDAVDKFSNSLPQTYRISRPAFPPKKPHLIL